MSTTPQQFHEKAFTLWNNIRTRHQTLRAEGTNLNGGQLAPAKSQVICIASGKGGTGKTLVTCNLAVLLARSGLRVSILDADMGLANAHLLLGVEPKYDISNLMREDQTLEDIMVRGPEGVRLLSGGSGKAELTAISNRDLFHLSEKLHRMEDFSDIILVDLAGGLAPTILKFLDSAHDIILVTNHEATSKSDALATINMLAEILGSVSVHLVINRARNREHAVVSFQQIWQRTNRVWRGQVKLLFSGWLPHNWYVQSSIIRGKPFVIKHPKSLPTQCLSNMSTKIHKHHLIWRKQQVGRWSVPSAFSKLKQISAE